MSLSSNIKDYALSLGYDHVGVTNVEGFPDYLRDLQERYETKARLALNSFLAEIGEEILLTRLKNMEDGSFKKIINNNPNKNKAEALSNEDEIVRAYVAWILGRVGGQEVLQVLEDALGTEHSYLVLSEIKDARARLVEKKRTEELCKMIL